MNIYKVTEDGISCSVLAHRPGLPIRKGWTIVPQPLENRRLFMVDGELTDQKPVELKEAEDFEFQAGRKVDMRIRAKAIQELIDEGELPTDYKEKPPP